MSDTKFTLTLIDVSGVQRYLFGSNKLAHNMGASWLVEQITSAWLKELLGKNLTRALAQSPDAKAELIYAGGGNALLLFRQQADALAFARGLSRKVLTEAPGLQMLICHTQFDWYTDALASAYADVQAQIANAKTQALTFGEPLGLSVNAVCVYTGLPAIKKDEDGRWVSAEIAAKQDTQNSARQRLKRLIPESAPPNLEFNADFNQYGDKGEASYIAVVHIDGNGMGRRKQALCDDYKNPNQNHELVIKLRQFSDEIKKASDIAIKETLRISIEYRDRRIKRDSDQVNIAPLVFGGDDITFVCEGAQGVSLAVIFLKTFAQQTVMGKPVSACAGIAIVKTHHPFARAYTLAAALCKSAKHALTTENLPDQSALDWHLAANSAPENLASLRQREYTVASGELSLRPLFLGNPNKPYREWQVFTYIMAEFRKEKEDQTQQKNENWTQRRNKVKDLLPTLRAGPKAVEQFKVAFGLLVLPIPANLSNDQEISKTGWNGKQCMYFDVLESLDLFEDMEIPRGVK